MSAYMHHACVHAPCTRACTLNVCTRACTMHARVCTMHVCTRACTMHARVCTMHARVHTYTCTMRVCTRTPIHAPWLHACTPIHTPCTRAQSPIHAPCMCAHLYMRHARGHAYIYMYMLRCDPAGHYTHGYAAAELGCATRTAAGMGQGALSTARAQHTVSWDAREDRGCGSSNESSSGAAASESGIGDNKSG